MADRKYIDIKEFRENGYLQEVNRLMLHPLGLALEVTIDADGTERLSGVWDERDDPEGIVYMGPDGIEQDKVDQVAAELNARIPFRSQLFEGERFIQVAGDEI